MAFKQVLLAGVTSIAVLSANAGIAQDAPDSNTVVATVNGVDITLGHMIVLRGRLPAQYQNLPHETLFNGVMDQLVQQTLLGENVTDLSHGSKLTLENEDRALRAQEQILSIADDVVTEEAVQAAYDEVYSEIQPASEFNASHILVDTEEEAIALVAELEAGADFAEMAKEKSTGPSGPNGGSLGWFGKGQMVPEFEAAVVDMDVDAVSAPVQTQFGWHVIKLNDARAVSAPSLEEVRGDLEEQVRRGAIDSFIAERMADSEITRMTFEDISAEMLTDFSLLEE